MKNTNNHPAGLYHKARRHVFATYEKNFRIEQAQFTLNKYRNTLPRTGIIGIEAELIFYSQYKKSFKLGAALDCGDKTDFFGEIEGKFSRFDVTTNLSYKSKTSNKIEEFLHEGVGYWYVNVDINKEDCELIPLHFPTCKECGNPVYNLVYLVPEKYTGYISDYFTIVKICIYCEDYEEKSDYNWVVSMFKPILEESYDYELNSTTDLPERQKITEEKEIYKKIENDILYNGNSIASLARKETNESIAFIGEANYFITGPKGDGYWATNIYWRNIWANNTKEHRYFFLPHHESNSLDSLI